MGARISRLRTIILTIIHLQQTTTLRNIPLEKVEKVREVIQITTFTDLYT